jgi:alkanesulfonate monooxygenase SsuD/methylene tetrahydromethanopterin reductase-like flavin-dependent oxidoreductase (luciferase family)
MRFGVDFPISGEYSEPRLLAQLALDAENGGWDGCFVWDHIRLGESEPVADPWIALAAMAAGTERIKLGPLVTPLYRRHPWRVARESVALDRLSSGRSILGVGVGSDLFGEISMIQGPLKDSVRAGMLDESLSIITGLWSGEQFSFAGKYYSIKQAQFLPRPLQSPRIPIWVAGTWPNKAPFRRAARYDGAVPVIGNLATSLTVRQVRELVEFIQRYRKDGPPFDIVKFGATSDERNKDIDLVTSYAAAGATWWVETVVPGGQSLSDVRRHICQGPPTI